MTCLETKDFVKLGKLVEKVTLDPAELAELQANPRKYLAGIVDIPAGHTVHVIQEKDSNESYMIIPSKKDFEEVKEDVRENGYSFPDEYEEIDPTKDRWLGLNLRTGDYLFSRCRRYVEEEEV